MSNSVRLILLYDEDKGVFFGPIFIWLDIAFVFIGGGLPTVSGAYVNSSNYWPGVLDQFSVSSSELWLVYHGVRMARMRDYFLGH